MPKKCLSNLVHSFFRFPKMINGNFYKNKMNAMQTSNKASVNHFKTNASN